MFSDEDTQNAIAAIIRNTLGPAPIIHPFWIEGYEEGDWPAFFRLPSGEVYGFHIRYRGSGQFAGPGPNAADQIHRYELVAVRSYSIGSEFAFAGDCIAIMGAIRAGGQIQVAPDCWHRTNGVQWNNADVYPFGSELCHAAEGTLEVLYRLC